MSASKGTRQQTPGGRVDLTVGSSLTWDGRTWTVVNTGDTRISLVGETNAFTEMPLDTFETLIKQGHITGSATSSPNSEISSLLAQASTLDLKSANERFDLVHRHLDDKAIRW